VDIAKGFVGNKLLTSITLTEPVHTAFIRYLDAMARLVNPTP
jgi:hypothetical protein